MIIRRRKKVERKIDGGVEKSEKSEKHGKGFNEVKESYQKFQQNPKTIKAKEEFKDFNNEYKKIMKDSISGLLPNNFRRGGGFNVWDY